MNNYYDKEKNKQNWSKACTVALVADAAYALIASKNCQTITIIYIKHLNQQNYLFPQLLPYH